MGYIDRRVYCYMMDDDGGYVTYIKVSRWSKSGKMRFLCLRSAAATVQVGWGCAVDLFGDLFNMELLWREFVTTKRNCTL